MRQVLATLAIACTLIGCAASVASEKPFAVYKDGSGESVELYSGPCQFSAPPGYASHALYRAKDGEVVRGCAAAVAGTVLIVFEDGDLGMLPAHVFQRLEDTRTPNLINSI